MKEPEVVLRLKVDAPGSKEPEKISSKAGTQPI